jgi:hypothetical protein
MCLGVFALMSAFQPGMAPNGLETDRKSVRILPCIVV